MGDGEKREYPVGRPLFLSSNAREDSPLAVDKEFNRVREKLEAVARGWSQALDLWPDVRLDQLTDRLLDSEPTIVHFSGHGGSDGALYLRDDDGAVHPMHPDGLARIFAEFDSVRMIVLNACYSKALADKLAVHTDVVIGMKTAVSDKAAILFAPAFYKALARGKSVAKAFNLAAGTVTARYRGEADIPQCVTGAGVDPTQLFFALDGPAPDPDPDPGPDPGPDPDAMAARLDDLSRAQKDVLIDLLLESRSLANPEDRHEIFARLRSSIRNRIRHSGHPKVMINSLVDTCHSFPGGIAELIAAVRFFEGDSRLVHRIDTWAFEVARS